MRPAWASPPATRGAQASTSRPSAAASTPLPPAGRRCPRGPTPARRRRRRRHCEPVRRAPAPGGRPDRKRAGKGGVLTGRPVGQHRGDQHDGPGEVRRPASATARRNGAGTFVLCCSVEPTGTTRMDPAATGSTSGHVADGPRCSSRRAGCSAEAADEAGRDEDVGGVELVDRGAAEAEQGGVDAVAQDVEDVLDARPGRWRRGPTGRPGRSSRPGRRGPPP